MVCPPISLLGDHLPAFAVQVLGQGGVKGLIQELRDPAEGSMPFNQKGYSLGYFGVGQHPIRGRIGLEQQPRAAQSR